MKAEYLLLMAACLAVTLPLEFWLRARVYRRPLRLLLALLPVVAVFYVWDAVAIARGHWDYSPDHTTGVLLPAAVPLEEFVFFVVIPICGLLTYEAVGTVLARRPKAAATAAGQPTPEPVVPGDREVGSGHPSVVVPGDREAGSGQPSVVIPGDREGHPSVVVPGDREARSGHPSVVIPGLTRDLRAIQPEADEQRRPGREPDHA